MRKISKEDLLEVDFLSETPATINQLRAAYVIQRMFERKACDFKFKSKKNIYFLILVLGILGVVGIVILLSYFWYIYDVLSSCKVSV